MKKIYVFVLIVLCLFDTIPCGASTISKDIVDAIEFVDQYDLLIDIPFEEYDTIIARHQGLIAIMRSIGMSDDIVGNWKYYIPDCYGWNFSDLFFKDGDEFVEPAYTMYSMNNASSLDYVAVAWRNKLALGERIGDRRYFFYDRPLTINETLIFMLRCLEGIPEYRTDTVYIYEDDSTRIEKAKMMGIVKASDGLIQGDIPITREYFCVLLQRFLNQHRHLYFNPFEDYPQITLLKTDVDKIITYREYLDEIKNS